jgi:hypothetical protein
MVNVRERNIMFDLAIVIPVTILVIITGCCAVASFFTPGIEDR